MMLGWSLGSHNFRKEPTPSETLCVRCSSINFREMFDEPFKMQNHTGQGIHNIIDLVSIEADAEASGCHLCRLFSQVRLQSQEDKEDNKRYTISVFSSVYMNSVRRHNDELFDTPVLAILPSDDTIRQLEKVPLELQFIYPTSLSRNSAEAILGRKVPAYLDYGILTNWIRFCCENHRETCGAEVGDLLPVPGFRLIDCSTGKIIPAPAGVEFVALSYVWGIAPIPPGTSYDQIPDSASLVIRDAMIVTSNIGYRYLWVDRYCIPQDDDRVKHHQIRRMDLIYQQAQLTIICAAGRDASDGIPGVSSVPRTPQPQADLPGVSLVSSLPSPQYEVNRSKWATRGWTYQEGLLSRRCLLFTQHQASFQCQTNYYPFESVNEPAFTRPRPQLTGYPTSRANNPLPLKFSVTASAVRDCLNEYSKRKLTYDSDTLNAIAGVLNAFVARNVLDGQVWGIPVIRGLSYHRSGGKTFRLMPFSDRVAHGLCWAQKPNTASIAQNFIRRRGGFPSWSWVGWVGLHSWEYLTPVHDGIGWPSNQPSVEPSHYPCTITFVLKNGTRITLGHEQIDAPFDLDMQGMPYLLIEAWSFNLRFTERRDHEISTCSWEIDDPEDTKFGPMLWIGLVRWNKDHEHEPAFHEHILNSTWTALLIGQGITYSGLDILVVEKVGDHFERAGILRLIDHRPKRTRPDIATLGGAEMRKKIFMLG
ncbi:heterokaryon incompatibility protein-domain-containing protein [Paraphoma chrysanthemicola]|uniref:Heterokaryon incompatibility protein-domain-containing protein n=1 Tax=Paraphoma chrysanthemicola TaxID=798071 RepID=A0A8K0W0E3_9PLEO|nr:heterokaryon incompatibility protein-domain-containing protein [Paraphoma chrysanthemicola]